VKTDITCLRQLADFVASFERSPSEVDLELFRELLYSVSETLSSQLSSDLSQFFAKLDIDGLINVLKQRQNELFVTTKIQESFVGISQSLKESQKSDDEAVYYKMSGEAKLASQELFETLLVRFDGDLALIKSYLSKQTEELKIQFQAQKINYSDYKKLTTYLASLRGKTTYRAMQNYVKAGEITETIDQTQGLRGLLGGKKEAPHKIESTLAMSGLKEVLLGLKNLKSKNVSGKSKSQSEEMWQNSQAYEKLVQKLEAALANQTQNLNADSLRLMAEVGFSAQTLTKFQRLVEKVVPIKFRRKIVLTTLAVASLFGIGATAVNSYQTSQAEQQRQQEIVALTEQFNQEWEDEVVAPEKQIAAQQDQVDQEKQTDSIPENPVSKETAEFSEALDVLRPFYRETVLPSRMEFFNQLPEDIRMRYFEAIGGPEKIDNKIVTIVVMGKDTTGERYGLDKDGNPLGRNDQTIVLLIDIKNNKISAVSIPRDIAIPTGMYGTATPSTFNGFTWVNQEHSTENGSYVSLDRSYAQLAITEATGYFIDGMVEFDFKSAADLIDKLFPDGVQITMTDSFVPENEILGKISGYRRNGYKPFVKGETYAFDGAALVQFLRARETRSGDTYQRESDATALMLEISKQMLNQIFTASSIEELAQRIDAIKMTLESGKSLETEGHLMGYFWGTKKDSTYVLLDLIDKIGIKSIYDLTRSWVINGSVVAPQFESYSPKTEEMEAASWFEHKTVFPGGNNQKDPYGQERNPLKFWDYFRQKVADLVKNN